MVVYPAQWPRHGGPRSVPIGYNAGQKVAFKLHTYRVELLRYRREDGREPFSEWLRDIRDKTAAARIRVRLRQVEAGNFGDCAPVGEGVIELRVHVGAGYRVYCGRHGSAIVLLISGGDKSSRARDIERAKQMWLEWKRGLS